MWSEVIINSRFRKFQWKFVHNFPQLNSLHFTGFERTQKKISRKYLHKNCHHRRVVSSEFGIRHSAQDKIEKSSHNIQPPHPQFYLMHDRMMNPIRLFISIDSSMPEAKLVLLNRDMKKIGVKTFAKLKNLWKFLKDFKMFSSLDHQPRRDCKKKYCKHKQSLNKKGFFNFSLPILSSILNIQFRRKKFACCLFFADVVAAMLYTYIWERLVVNKTMRRRRRRREKVCILCVSLTHSQTLPESREMVVSAKWKFNLIPTWMRTSRNVPPSFHFNAFDCMRCERAGKLTCLCISTFNPYDIS